MTVTPSSTLTLPAVGSQLPAPELHKSSSEVADDLGKLLQKIMSDSSSSLPSFSSFSDIKPAGESEPFKLEWQTLKKAADAACQNGHFLEAEKMWLKAVDLTKAFGSNDARRAVSLDSLASLYLFQEKYDQAIAYAQQAVDMVSRILGPNHINAANSLNTLAGAYYKQKKYSEAENLCVRILTIYNKNLGPDHADIGVAANNLAMVYQASGKYSLAELMYERALPIRKKALGANHPHVKTLVDNYTAVLAKTNKHTKASRVRAELENDGWHLFEMTMPISVPKFN